jgi:hypothetical protein
MTCDVGFFLLAGFGWEGNGQDLWNLGASETGGRDYENPRN